MIQVKDRWFRLLAILVPLAVIIYVSGFSSGKPYKFLSLLVSFFAIVLITEGSRFLVYNSRHWFSRRWRMLNVLIIGTAGTMIVLAISIILRTWVATGVIDVFQKMSSSVVINGNAMTVSVFGYALLNALVNFPILFLAYEMLYRSALLRHTEKEKARLEKEKLSAELSQLKGIVNPHFLFNNLNSLSSLIGEDPEKAQVFLDELTKVFRYLLRNNQTELTPLSEELKFIQTYYQLLQTRYGSAINMDINIDSSYNDLLIPPLTLQLLVENAVKHNRVQKDNPIRIELRGATGKKLVVRNTLLPREGKAESTGIGLYSINARYKMLNRPLPVIEKSDKEFSVIIPLIE